MTDDQTSDAPAAIVQDERLDGEPRLEGHRIGVFHVWTMYRRGKTSEDIADEMYPMRTKPHVQKALVFPFATGAACTDRR